jgi:hypothetical protein
MISKTFDLKLICCKKGDSKGHYIHPWYESPNLILFLSYFYWLNTIILQIVMILIDLHHIVGMIHALLDRHIH